MAKKNYKISIHESFEAAENAERNYIINQDPKERISQTVDLILRVYNTSREELRMKEKKKSIRIISYY